MKNAPFPLTKYLQTIIDDNPYSIEKEVATWLLDCEDPATYLQDLLNNGCQSGIVSHLIYYVDTYAFCDKYYHQIMDLYWAYEISIPKEVDIKNYLTWFSFEAVAQAIYNDIEEA